MCVYVSVGLSVCVCVALAVCVCVCARARIIYTAKKTEQSKPARLPCVVQQAGQAAQAYSKKGQRGAGTTVSCGPARLYSPPPPPPLFQAQPWPSPALSVLFGACLRKG